MYNGQVPSDVQLNQQRTEIERKLKQLQQLKTAANSARTSEHVKVNAAIVQRQYGTPAQKEEAGKTIRAHNVSVLVDCLRDGSVEPDDLQEPRTVGGMMLRSTGKSPAEILRLAGKTAEAATASTRPPAGRAVREYCTTSAGQALVSARPARR